MTRKEILIARLTHFLKEKGVYDDYILYLSLYGNHGRDIDSIAEWCVNLSIERFIIDRSFNWGRSGSSIEWSVLNSTFGYRYTSLPYERYEEEIDKQWDNMWEE